MRITGSEPDSVQDYFEIDRLVEGLAKIYSTACATTWFKLVRGKQPTREEYRSKVVEFMETFRIYIVYFPRMARDRSIQGLR
jgi:hypothetical protein